MRALNQRLICGVIAVLLSASQLLGQADMFTLKGIGKEKGQETAENKQTAQSNQTGTDQKPLVVKVVPPPHSDKETAAEAQERRETFENNRKMVGFNRSLVWATWILSIIGAVQLFIFGYQTSQLRKTVQSAEGQSQDLKRSIGEMTRLATAMESAAASMAISTNVGRESVEALRGRTAQQMRAYLCVVTGRAVYQEQEKGVRFDARPLLINAGHTPAHKVSYKANAAILPVPLPADFAFPLPPIDAGGGILGPQQNAEMFAMVNDFCADADVTRIKTGVGLGLYVWGVVTYEDVFREPQQTRFCQHITWINDQSIHAYYIARHSDAT